jgi:hypothetical protein
VPIWIPVTLAAALFQCWRTAMQQKLRHILSVNGAGFVRYLYGAPTALVLLTAALWITGAKLPAPSGWTLLWATAGGLTQILATNLLIMAFGFRSLFIDDALIPVEFLVNHRSIIWDDRAREIEIYHVELAQHGVLIADGAPAESYRDDGNRWLFRNGNSGWGLPPQLPCALVLTGGPIVDAIWRRLLDRADPRPGLPTTADPDLHLLVDGRRVDGKALNGGVHLFHLSRRSASVRIVSRAAAPQELGWARDPRSLGVAVRRVVVRQGSKFRVIEGNDAMVTAGFHGFEPDIGARWTTGDAVLPAAAFADFAGVVELLLHLAGTAHYVEDGTMQRAA